MSKKAIGAILVAISLLSQAIPSSAGPGGGHGWSGWGPGGKAMFWTDFGLTVGTLALGTIVAYLPPERTVIYSGGNPYYCYAGNYFTAVPGGFVLVNPPMMAPAPLPVMVQRPRPMIITMPPPPPPPVVMRPLPPPHRW